MRLATLAAQIEASSAIGSRAIVPKCCVSFELCMATVCTRSTIVPFELFLLIMVWSPLGPLRTFLGAAVGGSPPHCVIGPSTTLDSRSAASGVGGRHERLRQRLGVPGSIVTDTVDEHRRCTVDAASHATHEVFVDA